MLVSHTTNICVGAVLTTLRQTFLSFESDLEKSTYKKGYGSQTNSPYFALFGNVGFGCHSLVGFDIKV